MAINGRERDTGESMAKWKYQSVAIERETGTVGEQERGTTKERTRERTTLLQV